MSKYKQAKEKARIYADIWHENMFPRYKWSYGEIAFIEMCFYRLGRRYGLLTEFREKGILMSR